MTTRAERPPEPVELTAPRSKMIGLFILSIAFVAACVWILGMPNDEERPRLALAKLLSWIVIPVCSLGGIYFLVEAILDRPVILLDSRGITVKGPRGFQLDWTAIDHAFVYRVSNQAFLGFVTKAESSGEDVQGWVSQLGDSFVRNHSDTNRSRIPSRNIPAGLLDRDLGEFAAFLAANYDLRLSSTDIDEG